MSRFDWKPSAIALFAELEAMPTVGTADMLDVCRRHDSPIDLQLAFEYAVCAGVLHVADVVALALCTRDVSIQAEPLLRIALWPTRTGNALPEPLRNSRKKRLYWASVGQPRMDKLVHALIRASESPEAFVWLLEMIPPQSLSAAGATAIVDAAWHPTMIAALASSWIKEKHPDVLARCSARPDGVAWQEIDARYAAAEPGALDLETSCLCYWTPENRHEAPERETDAFAKERATTDMHRALNAFLRTPAFGPVQPCADPAHAICRMLAKK